MHVHQNHPIAQIFILYIFQFKQSTAKYSKSGVKDIEKKIQEIKNPQNWKSHELAYRPWAQ